MATWNSEGITVWLTGLPCAGKTTVSVALAAELRDRGLRVEVLDGDVIRTNLSRGLGFSREDRDTNVKRVGFVCDLLSRNGVIAIAALVSPYRSTRNAVRETSTRFVEVHVSCPVEECSRRDVKGMYAKARAGEITGFTGVDDPYEPPEHADVTIHTREQSIEESVQHVLSELERIGHLSRA